MQSVSCLPNPAWCYRSYRQNFNFTDHAQATQRMSHCKSHPFVSTCKSFSPSQRIIRQTEIEPGLLFSALSCCRTLKNYGEWVLPIAAIWKYSRKAASLKQASQKANWRCLSAYHKPMQNYIPSEHPNRETYWRNLKACWSRSEERGSNMELELPASSLRGKTKYSKLSVFSRSQTVIHQHHPCQIAVDSKLGKNTLDAENKSGFD